jgi:phosphoserine phosphatase RsbU/P
MFGHTDAIQRLGMRESGKVLVADDQPDVLEALRLLLKGGGFAVETVNSPTAVISRTKESTFDAVLIDLNYTRDTTSGTEGMDLLAHLRSQSDVPVIVMTAWATLDIAIEAIRRGANDFIQKPWDNTHVLETVRKQIETSQQRASSAKWESYEREDARTVHNSLLRVELPNIRGVDVAVWSRPKFQVGGDYYEACELQDGRVLFCIADVCGKGVSATIQMSNLQGALKALASETNPANLCRTLNRVLHANLPSGRFVSLFVGVMDPSTGTLSYCNAGHLPPLWLRTNAQCTPLETGGPVLGCFEDCDYGMEEVALAPGDCVVLFTDGVSEASSQQGAEFGESVLQQSVGPVSRSTALAVRDAIVAAVNAHCAEQFDDDATVLVLQRTLAA